MFPCYTANKHMRLLTQVYGIQEIAECLQQSLYMEGKATNIAFTFHMWKVGCRIITACLT